MSLRIAINGFGRIGRLVFRALAQNPEAWRSLEVVAVNDLTTPATLAHLLKYDSVHGRFPGSVVVREGGFEVNGRMIQVMAEKDPSKLPWKTLGVEYVIESTGRFTEKEKAEAHLVALAGSSSALQPKTRILPL